MFKQDSKSKIIDAELEIRKQEIHNASNNQNLKIKENNTDNSNNIDPSNDSQGTNKSTNATRQNFANQTSKREQQILDGARGPLDQNTNNFNLPAGSKTLLLLMLIIVVIFGIFFTWKTWQASYKEQQRQKHYLVRNTLPPLEPLPKPTVNSDQVETSNLDNLTIPTAIDNSANDSLKTKLSTGTSNPELQLRRLSPELIDTANSNNANLISDNHLANYPDSNHSPPAGALQTKLQPLQLTPAAAGILQHPNYLLTQGTIIDCQLETKMITTQDGMAACYTTRNTYSTNGKVILIDRGSKVVGHYQGGMQQGQARIFVLWSRIETPNGVVVNLDSPGSGPLGESGVGGAIDTHFWQRFGGSIMISLIGDFGQYLANQGQKGKNNHTIHLTNTTQGMQAAATEALKNSINIPPTLYKNQGERITIFVARDLDFSKVYELRYQP